MSKIKLELNRATLLAEKIKAALLPGCERIEIAGSIRRQRLMIGDIEIVAIPKMVPAPGSTTNFFTGECEQVSALDCVIDTLIATKPHFRFHTTDKKNGDKYKKFQVDIGSGQWITLDLFITTPEQWGIIMAIRTGPADFSKHIVTQAHKAGPLPPGFSVSGGWVRYLGQEVDMPTEESVFDLVGYEYRSPTERDGLPCGHDKDAAVYVYAKSYAKNGETVKMNWQGGEINAWLVKAEKSGVTYIGEARSLWGHRIQLGGQSYFVGEWLHEQEPKIIRAFLERWQSWKTEPLWRVIETLPDEAIEGHREAQRG